MSQDAGAAQSKRSPAYVYGPMVYQFPPESEGESGKSQSGSDKPSKFPTTALIVLLVIGALILYLKGKAMDVGQVNFKSSFGDDQIFRSVNGDNRKSLAITQARVATNSLYLREGPGMIYVATYLLPEHWRVSLIGDYETDDYGEVWARVLVQTDEGLQEGWVSRRYLR
jgi:hypothetical protein